MRSWLIVGEFQFLDFDQALRPHGWQRDTDAVKVNPVEPAFASWSRDPDGQLEYVYNSVFGARALAVRGEDVDTYLEELSTIVPLIASPLALSQLESIDAKTMTLAMAEIVKAQVVPVLCALRDDSAGDVVQQLKPHAEDYELVFVGETAPVAMEAYGELWADMRKLWRRPGPQQRDVLCYVAPAGMLTYENELSSKFPGGYQAVASQFEPTRVWVAWKYVEPGAKNGLAFNGLVWVNDHWAWFPKPYKILRPYL